MPRIDPLQLLKCLSVLLTPEGGILSRDEVPRLVNLMTKFSKKLVSKCVYVLILCNTDTSLLELFMAEGGWTLIQTWLEDAMKTTNDDLVVEILKLLLITPVDIERLKSNTIPRLVKTLTKRDPSGSVKELSTTLVQKWLAIVKSTTQEMVAQSRGGQGHAAEVASEVTVRMEDAIEGGEGENTSVDNKDAISTGTFYKLTVRGGKQVIRRLSSSENEAEADASIINGDITEEVVSTDLTEQSEKEASKKRDKSEKERSHSKSSSSSLKSRSSSSSKDKERHKSSSSSKSSSTSSSKDRDKSSSSKDRDKKDKDKYRSNGAIKDRSSRDSKDRRDSKDKKDSRKDKDKYSDKNTREKQAEKDKDTLAKIKPQTLDKIGRIPKKSGSETSKEGKAKENEKPKEREDKKKGTMSIEVRKNSEERPKTVKIFNSKMRSTGLEEEVKPPPPRIAKKPQIPTVLPALPQKRSSPPRESLVPEKKMKLEVADRPIPERPGSIKLIPPKPKPAVLLESDIFMDALTAATAKKEPKKRKRRTSVSKDSAASPPSSPTKDQQVPTSTSPSCIKNIAPPNFYQDTLETNEKSENDEIKEEKKPSDALAEDARENEQPSTPTDPNDTSLQEETPEEPKKPKIDGLKGVLVYIKKKGPKKSIKWKSDDELVEIRHFELDETERVNVTKTFMDMAKMELSSEREALQLSRKLPSEDLMESQISWRFPYIVDQPELKVQPGSNSLEKDIQFAREKNVLQALYFNKRMIPDNPAEPLPENHQMSDPVIIPLDDPECQEIDLRNTPWPEPKAAPPVETPVNIPPIFRNVPHPQQAFQNFQPMNPAGFQAMPRFAGPNGPVAPPMTEGPPMMDASAFLGPQAAAFVAHPSMMNNNMMGHQNVGPPPEMMGQAPIDPSMFGSAGPMGPPEGFNQMMNESGFGMPYNQPNMPMFHHQNQNSNNNNNNYNMNRGGGGGRGFRRGGGGGGSGGGWVRLNNGPNHGGNWNRGGGPGPRTNRVCKNVKNHGYCRNIDNCPFFHPS